LRDQDEAAAEKHMKKELRTELKLGEAEMEPREIARHNASILEKLFYIFFKVL
jgi:hypothetical protein